MSISDLIVVMKDGILHQMGKPQEVYENPIDLFVAKFLGTPPINVFDGKIKENKLFIGNEAVLDINVSDREVDVAIRPEGFIVDDGGCFTCELNRIEVMGRDISVVAKHEKSQNVDIRAIIDAENMALLNGSTVKFNLKPKKVYVFEKNTGKRIYF